MGEELQITTTVKYASLSSVASLSPYCPIMDILPSLLSLSCLICVTYGIEYRKPITNMVLDGFDRGLSTCVSLLATDSETYKGGAHN